MATRHLDTPQGAARFDHGAQYFTVRDPGFATQVAAWQAQGLAAPWPEAGAAAFVATPGMNSLPAALAQGLDVRCGQQVTALRHEAGGWHLSLALPEGNSATAGPFTRLVVALPAEQAAALLATAAPAPSADLTADLAARAAATPSAPCWTVLAALPDALPEGTSCWRHLGAIGWAARNNTKPGRSGPEALVLQAGPEWSRQHLEDPAAQVGQALLGEFFHATGLPARAPLAVHAHRWRYARSGSAGVMYLWQRKSGLGLCGDWLPGPRVEDAWRSGLALAGAILAG